MVRERIIHNPFELGFDIMYNEYPPEFLEQLNAPGKFRRKANTIVYIENGNKLQMDTSYIVDPDYETIFQPMVCNGEHQSTPVDDEKLEIMGRYRIQQIHDKNLPQLSWIASHIPKEKHKQEHKITPSDNITPVFLNLGEKDNNKRLSNMRKIINNQDQELGTEVLDLGIIVLFAPRHKACEITEEVIALYNKAVGRISKKMEYILYSVIRLMIDAYSDNKKDYERRINMLNENTSTETTERFVTIEIMQNKIQQLEIDNGRIPQLEMENERIPQLEMENERIPQLEREIEMLKQQLNSK